MRIRDIKREARASLKSRWGFAILLSIISFGVYTIIPLIIEILFSGNLSTWYNQEGAPANAQFISWLFTIALYPIMYGFNITFLEIIRKEPVKFKNVFQGFDATKYFKILGAFILTSVYTFLWFLLFMIPAIIKSISYSQVYFVLKDNPDLSPRAAITKSRQLMKGNKWKYFLLTLSFIGWTFLSILTVFIGFIWLVPYMTASLAAFYDSLEKSNEVKESLE
ncbi:DUF975 family protein [Neobacillus sp. PS3-40]|uniref:DUF975 family protein n=1 Tax=Neobacillus sp. PS3-40 TaxID=3070679 RepID=UPI0027E101C3|nr:DUF975 family protein [Neobacillus sp. PS3-40]WML44813.1 DUF975 family protein [Neobacillus sp. PS3-40]